MNPFSFFEVEPALEKLLDAKCRAAIRSKYREFVAHSALKKSATLEGTDNSAHANADNPYSMNDIRLAATILLDVKLANKWLSGDMSFIPKILNSFEKEDKDDPRRRKVSARCIEMSLQSHNVKILNSRLSCFPDLSLNEIDVRICWVQENMIQRFFKKDCIAIPNIVSLRLYSNMLHQVSKHISKLVRLQSLWLHDNFLSCVPDELCDVTSLTELQLHKNPLIVLMPRIYTMTRLQKLTWDQKFVTNISPEVAAQGPQNVMKYLKLLADNRQSEGFLCLENLGLLKLPEWSRDTLPKYLIKCTENATLRWNNLNDVSTLSIAPMLRSICFAYNKLLIFPKGLELLPSLQVIDLSFNQIQVIDNVLLLMTQLQVLDLRNNFVTHILLALSELTTLKRVDLQNNIISVLPLWWPENWLQNVVELSWNHIKEPDLMSLGRSQNEIDQVLKKIYRSHQSGSLCITGMSWDKIPGMFLFEELVSLDCSNNIIATWPESIVVCKNLRSLCMMRNCLAVVPDGVAMLSNLTYLDLSWNCIRNISKKLASCVRIEIMNVAKNAFQKLPSTFGLIGSSLRDLNLSGSGLTEFPDSMDGLSHLINLDASRNAISVLPQSVCLLSTLQTLNLSHNFLKILPDEIGCLNELVVLNLSKNVLHALPRTIRYCSSLRSIFLDRNNLSRLPIEMCEMNCLIHLDISENRVLMRHGSIGSTPFEHKMPLWKLMHGLRVFACANETKRLRLEHTGLSVLPAEVLDLSEVADLSLRGINCAETLGLLSGWSTLTRLDLRDTGVSEAPSFLGKWKNLKELFLDCRDHENMEDSEILQKALSGFMSIRKLVETSDPPEELNVAPSLLAFHDIAEKAELSGILQLKGLHLHAFPDFFFEMGRSLSEIDLSRNLLVEIPNSALGLVALKTLRLNNNRLKTIPSSFAVCTALTMMNLSHNCLQHIPFAINGMCELRHAFLQCNEILFLDGPFEGCTKLLSLNVSQNRISDISSKFSCCKRLQNIDLSFNNLEHMIFVGLYSLQSASLSNNRIRCIETSFLSCTSLKRLDISSNLLEDVSTLLSSRFICQLVISNNHVAEIPDCVKLAVSLVELHASNNHIESVSASLFACPAITVVDFKNNCISYFTALAEKSETLSFLDISGNPGIQLCPSLGFLRSEVEFVLEIQNLDWPDPSSLSEKTWNAVKVYLQHCYNALKDDALNLKDLRLSGNLRTIPLDRKGTKVPVHMFDRLNCKRLTLERNILSSIPEDILGLQNLQELNVSNQAIEELPASIFTMHHLKCLNVRHTAIVEIPQNVSLCTSLKFLLIGCNNIRSLPENIFATPSLEVLDIGRCPVQKVPTSHHSDTLKIIVLNQEEFNDFFEDSLEQNVFSMNKITSKVKALDENNMVLRRTQCFLTFLKRFRDSSVKEIVVSQRSTLLAIYFDCCKYKACPEYLTMMLDCRTIKIISISFNDFGSTFESLMRCPWDNVVELSLVDCQMEQLPSASGNAWSSLTRLSLARNRLKHFPPQLLLLHRLVEMDLSDNPLVYIPITVGSFKKMKKLHTFDCPLNGNSPNLPLARAETVVGFFQSLWSFYTSGIFDLSSQSLEQTPKELRSKVYSSLKELRLQDNAINVWKSIHFSHLVSIKYLDLSINRLADIDLTAMQEAQYINVSFNILMIFPLGIENMMSLTTLNASENRITAVPEQLALCTSLTHLKLSRNFVSSIAHQMTRLKKLETIELDGNQLSAIPRFCAGNRVRLLSIDENPVMELPVWLCQSRSLKFLSFRNAKVEYLPCELGNALQLESLMYDGNPLESPPIEIRRSGPFLSMKFLEMMGNCIYTGRLNLKEMLISELPPEMEMFDSQCKTPWCVKLRNAFDRPNSFETTSLVNLDISNNKIRDLECGFLHLFSNLVVLNMEKNNIKTLPKCFRNLIFLTSLSVKNNSLQSLFPAIPACTSIESLDASHNYLRQIDASILQLQKLVSLNILKNQLQDLPVEIGRLTNLRTLTADQRAVDNSVPSTVSGQGTTAFVIFMAKILKSQETSVLELMHGDLFMVPRSISKLQGTIKVDLSHNNLNNDALSDFLIILEALEKERQLELSKKSADEKLQSAIQQTLFAGKNNVKSGFAAVPMLLSLQTLVLAYNRLTEFPMVVSKIRQLTCMDLRDNRIEILPDGIRALTTLMTLNISQQYLKYPPIHVAFFSELNLKSEKVDLEHFFKFVTATSPDDNKLVFKVVAYGLTFIPDPWIVGDSYSDAQTVSLCDNMMTMQHDNDFHFFARMKQLTSLDLSGNYIIEIPGFFSALVKLKFLNIARNSISEISPMLLSLIELESLSIDNNKIATIPNGITSLLKLQFLSLKGNPFTDLPPSMCKLGDVLQTLLVDDTLNFPPKEILWEGTAAIFSELNKVYHSMMSTSQMLMKGGYHLVPQMLAECTRVTQLDLSKNAITAIPDFFSKLVHLETIDFSQNMLCHLGGWVTFATALQNLDVSNNNLSVLSSSLGTSKSLKFIDASFNKIVIISRAILGSVSLLTLNIMGNAGPITWLHFQGLKPRFDKARRRDVFLSSVEDIQAQNSNAPASLAFATYVWCSSQPLWSVRNTSGDVVLKDVAFDLILDALNDGIVTDNFEIMSSGSAVETRLFRTFKRISSSSVFSKNVHEWRKHRAQQYVINSDTWFLPTTINSLNAQNCRFLNDSLPTALLRSRALGILDISDCMLTKIPRCIGFLTAVRVLKLMRNKIGKLPDELGYCLNVEYIDLSQNSIQNLPEIFAGFVKLVSFTISDNKLECFPKSFATLSALKTLSFANNQVETLDNLVGLRTLVHLDGCCNSVESMNALCACERLKSVWLSENKICYVSEDIRLMTDLECLNLRSNLIEILPTTLILMTNLKTLNLHDNASLMSLLPPAVFDSHVNGPVIRRYLSTVKELDDCKSLDLTFFNYKEVPRFAFAWVTRRQKARNRWFWAIGKTKSIVKKSVASALEMTTAEAKASEIRADQVSKVLGAKETNANIALEKNAFDASKIDSTLDEYYGRETPSPQGRIRRIPWHQVDSFDREKIESEHPVLMPIINNELLSSHEKFEQIVDTMLLQTSFFQSMIDYSWYYSNQKIPDGGKMTTQGPLRIHGIVMLWLRDVLDLNSYVWADILDENDAVLLYEWTQLSALPFFAQFLLLTTKCVHIITSMQYLQDIDVLNEMSMELLKNHRSIIKKRAYRDAYVAAIEMGVSDIQIVLLSDDEVILRYGKVPQLAESIEEDWESVVGLEEKTAFLRNDEGAVVAYSKFQEEFFLLRVLISTDDFTPLPKYRQFSFVSESTRLFLFGNNLKQISPLLSCLDKLCEINLCGNELVDLPKNMTQLFQLQHLQLSRNRLQFFPEVLAELGANLVTLTLAWNSIRDIPDMVRRFSRIEELNMSYNRITSAANLMTLDTLKTLHLANNNMARIITIAKMSSLTILTLNHNPINYFPASFGNANENLKLLAIDSWTRAGLPPCYMQNAEFWMFTPATSQEVFDRPL
jgi:Leucine-rich repeat (LRR) protein